MWTLKEPMSGTLTGSLFFRRFYEQPVFMDNMTSKHIHKL